MPRRLARLVLMDAAELGWRARTATRSRLQRAAFAVRAPRWERRDLATRLTRHPLCDRARAALGARDWAGAHRELQGLLLARASRFVIGPNDRAEVSQRINGEFPDAAADARGRADRLVEGRYDLLGYHDLRFGAPVDWHADPVHGCRVPAGFWSAVPYLDPRCGDHKIIWELNRHQHWIALGRAYWLTGDPKYRRRCLDELKDWLGANPPLTGVNWASMLELGFRSLSWIWALHFFATPAADGDDPWTVDLLLGLDRQLDHVEQNLSHYFSPNTHLLGEALALYVAGRAIPELAASPRRAATGRRVLVAEIGRQIGADGGHCERSTHYHRYALDFYLLALAVARLARDPIAAVFSRAVERLAVAARVLADDSGRAPHFGDDDGGQLFPVAGRKADDWRDSLGIAASATVRDDLRIGSRTEEELWLLNRAATTPGAATARIPESRQGSAALDDMGYFVSRSAAGDHLVIDGGRHGYENAGHAHADALSLTLSLGGHPLLIDPGTACYTIDPALRDRFRSTASHNTLVVDGRPQSIARGPFHWAQTVDAVAHRWRAASGFDYFDGSHDGYAPIQHRRRVFALHGGLIVVADYVGGDGAGRRHEAAGLWHVAPEWEVDVRGKSVSFAADGRRATLFVPQGRIESFRGDGATGLGWHSPVYGRVEPATTLRITHDAAAPFWIVSVFDLQAGDPVTAVDWLPVWAEAGTMAHAVALRIVRDGSTGHLLMAEPSRAEARATWRVAEFETDARMLFCRVSRGDDLTDLALVDGSFVRSAGRHAVALTLGRVVPALFVDHTSIRTFTPCAASPAL